VPAGPTLNVSKRSKDILVSIEPFPQEGRSVLPVTETAQRIKLVRFDASHRADRQHPGPQGAQRARRGRAAAAGRPGRGGADADRALRHRRRRRGSDAAEQVDADPRPHVHLTPFGQGDTAGLNLELYVHPFGDAGPQLRPGEGSATLLTELDGRAGALHPRPEARTPGDGDCCFASCPALADDGDAWSWQLDDPEAALTALEQLHALGDAVVLDWPKGKRIALSTEVGLGQLRAAVNATAGLARTRRHPEPGRRPRAGDARAAGADRRARGRFVRLGERDFLSLSKALRRRLDGLRGLTDRGRFHPLAAPAIAELIGRHGHGRFAGLGRAARAPRRGPRAGPAGALHLQAELRDYQVEGYRWLARLAHWGAGACLADDMGLGKTLQALALILSRAPDGPTLVLAPTSVCGNWLDEAARFAPTLRPLRFGPGDRAAMLEQAGPFDLIVAATACCRPRPSAWPACTGRPSSPTRPRPSRTP
jgi:hypothetical protein